VVCTVRRHWHTKRAHSNALRPGTHCSIPPLGGARLNHCSTVRILESFFVTITFVPLFAGQGGSSLKLRGRSLEQSDRRGANEFRMTKVVIDCPFKERYRGYQLRLEPAASLHIFGGQPFAPSALSRFEKIPKWAFGGRHTLEVREYRPSRSWREAVPNSSRIH
jgi:hypothetical protein